MDLRNNFLGLNGEDWASGLGAFVNILICVITLCAVVFFVYATYVAGIFLYVIGGLVGVFAAIYALAWAGRRWRLK